MEHGAEPGYFLGPRQHCQSRPFQHALVQPHRLVLTPDVAGGGGEVREEGLIQHPHLH